jgi:transcriptional regulator with XRE-family HTH domain
MSGERPPTEEDKARGERMRKLRESLGMMSQESAATMGHVTRVELSKLESGMHKFTSAPFQERVATLYGTTTPALIAYARGDIDLDALKAGFGPIFPQMMPPRPRVPRSAVTPTPVEAAQDEGRLLTSWRAAKPLIPRRLDGKDPEDIKAVVESLEQEAFYSSGDPTGGRGVVFWLEAADERYAMLRGKAQIGARVATELDEEGGAVPHDDEPAPPAQKGTALAAGMTPTRSSRPPKTRTRKRSIHDADETLPVVPPGKLTGSKKTR